MKAITEARVLRAAPWLVAGGILVVWQAVCSLFDVSEFMEASSSFGGPFHRMSTSDSFAAASAPAWIAFQNSCVVPFGITAMTTRSCFAPQATNMRATRMSTRTARGEKRMRMDDMISNPGC